MVNLSTCDGDETNVSDNDSDDESSTISHLVDRASAIEHNNDDDDDKHYKSFYQQELLDPSWIIEEMAKDKEYFNKNASYLEEKNRMIRNRIKVKLAKEMKNLPGLFRMI